MAKFTKTGHKLKMEPSRDQTQAAAEADKTQESVQSQMAEKTQESQEADESDDDAAGAVQWRCILRKPCVCPKVPDQVCVCENNLSHPSNRPPPEKGVVYWVQLTAKESNEKVRELFRKNREERRQLEQNNK